MLPIAMAASFTSYMVMEGFGLSAANAVFGTLALMFSPLVFPLEASMMTDIPGLLALLVCIAMCQRAVRAVSRRGMIVWLLAAGAGNILLGSVRQIAWLGVLVIVPSSAAMLRRKLGLRTTVATATAALVAGAASIAAMLHWFHSQPLAVPENLLVGHLGVINYVNLIAQTLRFAMSFALTALPLLVAWVLLLAQRTRRQQMRVFVLAALAAWFFFALPHTGPASTWRIPFQAHVWESLGLAQPVVPQMMGTRQLVLGETARTVASILIALCGFTLLDWLLQPGPRMTSISEVLFAEDWREVRWLLGPFAIAYLLLLVPRGLTSIVFDRYWIGLLPAALIVLLRLHQQCIAPRLPRACYALLAAYALFAVCATHDWFALNRARVAAANHLMTAGVARTQILGGFDYDGTTQIEAAGSMNDPRLSSYVPNGHIPPLPPKCAPWFTQFTPAIHPEYFVTQSEMNCLAGSSFAPVEYQTWLPPFHRRVYVQQLR